MADGIETGMYPSERLSAWEERATRLLLTSFPCGHPFHSRDIQRMGTPVFKTQLSKTPDPSKQNDWRWHPWEKLPRSPCPKWFLLWDHGHIFKHCPISGWIFCNQLLKGWKTFTDLIKSVEFDVKRVPAVSSLRFEWIPTWHLPCHNRTPNFTSIKQFTRFYRGK